MNIQMLAAKHIEIMTINPETNKLETKEEGYNPYSGMCQAIPRAHNCILKVGNYLTGGCLQDGVDSGSLLDNVSKLSLIHFDGISYVVDVFSYFDLDMTSLETLTPLEYIRSLSQDTLDDIVRKLKKLESLPKDSSRGRGFR